MPSLDSTDQEKLTAIPGTPPDLTNPPKGDAFALRDSYAMKIDFEQEPPMYKVSDTHFVKSWLLHPDAPKVEPPEAVKAKIRQLPNTYQHPVLMKEGEKMTEKLLEIKHLKQHFSRRKER